jgi:hypothetical protein
MYRLHYNGMTEDRNTEAGALTQGKKLVGDGITAKVEIYKLHKVVYGEMHVKVTDPGVVTPHGDVCGNS